MTRFLSTQQHNTRTAERLEPPTTRSVNVAPLDRLPSLPWQRSEHGNAYLPLADGVIVVGRRTTLPTPAERKSLEILKAVPLLADAADIARAVHERHDGSGFPIGLREDEIPLSARIIAVAGAYDELAHATPREAGTRVYVKLPQP